MEINFELIQEKLINYAPKVVGAILMLVIGFWLANYMARLFRKAVSRQGMEPSVQGFLASMVSVGLKILVLISVAQMFGFETTSFIAILGALVFAIGMALQGSLGHFASGIMILTLKPYRVGDLVDLSDKVGHVKEIGVFNTTLLTLDNRKVIIPNGVVTSGIITNISGQGEIRVDMTFGIGYTDDIDVARNVIERVATGCKHILPDKPVDIFVSELADSSVNFAVRPWCKSEHYWEVYFYMHEQIKKAFDKEGVSIPFPQLDVHQG